MSEAGGTPASGPGESRLAGVDWWAAQSGDPVRVVRGNREGRSGAGRDGKRAGEDGARFAAGHDKTHVAPEARVR